MSFSHKNDTSSQKTWAETPEMYPTATVTLTLSLTLIVLFFSPSESSACVVCFFFYHIWQMGTQLHCFCSIYDTECSVTKHFQVLAGFLCNNAGPDQEGTKARGLKLLDSPHNTHAHKMPLAVSYLSVHLLFSCLQVLQVIFSSSLLSVCLKMSSTLLSSHDKSCPLSLTHSF